LLSGYTPLIVASGYGHVDVVQLLLDYGADPNKKDYSYGLSALARVGENARHAEAPVLETAKCLIDRGANAEVQRELTLLDIICGLRSGHEARETGYADFARYLLEKNMVSPNERTGSRSPLAWAIYCYNFPLAEAIFSNGGTVSEDEILSAMQTVIACAQGEENIKLREAALVDKGDNQVTSFIQLTETPGIYKKDH
jgi:ankyrin repeat protein